MGVLLIALVPAAPSYGHEQHQDMLNAIHRTVWGLYRTVEDKTMGGKEGQPTGRDQDKDETVGGKCAKEREKKGQTSKGLPLAE